MEYAVRVVSLERVKHVSPLYIYGWFFIAFYVGHYILKQTRVINRSPKVANGW